MFKFLLVFLIATPIFAQQSGIVEYEYIYTPDFNKSAKDYIEHKAISTVDKAAEYAKQYRYILKFNPKESLYQIETGIDPDDVEDPMAYHLSKMILGHGIFYQNLPKHYTLNQKETMHKLFLVKDSIKNDWTINYEKKMIGGYKCYKATKKCPCGRDIVAWFTPEIPLPFGPAGYAGTPGLILQLTFFKHTLRMKKLTLRKKPVVMTPPSKGEPITKVKLENRLWNKRMEIMTKNRR
ncbi:MAG TPA: GLPGLI family protein [Flavobacteriales bacterium]|nr:GLPGLI family protein [Flavobacteriales bacterium]